MEAYDSYIIEISFLSLSLSNQSPVQITSL